MQATIAKIISLQNLQKKSDRFWVLFDYILVQIMAHISKMDLKIIKIGKVETGMR